MDARLDPVSGDLITIVSSVADVALVRVWISGPGDLCNTCPMASECADRSRCLHLVRSDGISRQVDGPFRRFPFGAREVGRVATTLEPMIRDRELAALGLADPAWLALHRIEGFGAWPLATGGRCLGVIAVFARAPLSETAIRAITAATRLAAGTLQASPSLAGTARAVAVRRAGVEGEASTSASVSPSATSMADAQRSAILAALERTGGRVSGQGGAAELLGMKPTTLESRMRKLGMRKPPRPAVVRG